MSELWKILKLGARGPGFQPGPDTDWLSDLGQVNQPFWPRPPHKGNKSLGFQAFQALRFCDSVHNSFVIALISKVKQPLYSHAAQSAQTK